jgi:hypothetical protein
VFTLVNKNKLMIISQGKGYGGFDVLCLFSGAWLWATNL